MHDTKDNLPTSDLPNIVKKKRGPKPKHFLDRLIPKVWFYAVRSRGNWSDTDLDVEFIPDKDGLKHAKATRVRTFEAIRKTGRTPSNGNHNLRDFDLVALVDAHPNFHGTAKVIRSQFWRLLAETPQSLERATLLVEECFTILGLVRLQGIEEMLWHWTPGSLPWRTDCRKGISGDLMNRVEYQLHQAIKDLPLELDLLALLGALYREACLSFHPDAAKVFGQYFNNYLMDFCSQAWIIEVVQELEDISRHRILYGEKDYFPDPANAEMYLYLNPVEIAGGLIVNAADPIYKKLKEDLSFSLK